MYDFTVRLRTDARTLARCRDVLRGEPRSAVGLNELRSCSHKLAGAAGIFGYEAVSSAAAAVENAVDDLLDRRAPDRVATLLDALLQCIEESSRSGEAS
jgi:HPt (histidine-containing phosphotransfer) domain-containing protein